jgi:predicted Zn-dependent peptidase
MRTIRERDGYTYGIYAGLEGFLERTQGDFTIRATFSPGNWREALEATRREIGIFIRDGLTEEALATKKDEIAGRYLIGLGTSRGLAGMLLDIAEKGRPLEYLYEYPRLIRVVTLDGLQALAPLVAPERLSMAASGTFSNA